MRDLKRELEGQQALKICRCRNDLVHHQVGSLGCQVHQPIERLSVYIINIIMNHSGDEYYKANKSFKLLGSTDNKTAEDRW